MRFVDSNVEKTVLAALGMDTLDDENQLKEIVSLELEGVRRLDDLMRLSELRSLVIYGSTLENPEALAALTSLTRLDLHNVSGFQSVHIAPLKQLKSLSITCCGEMDLEPLSRLRRLSELSLWEAGISDITAISALTRLEWLDLTDNPVKDVTPLLGLKHLKTLNLDLEGIADKRLLAKPPLCTALSRCPDFAENAPQSPRKREPRGIPRLQWIADVHPRLHFCRDAMLLRLSGGLERLVCRDYGANRNQDDYDLYLDSRPLLETRIPSCGTCACMLKFGYGDGIARNEEYLGVRDRLNSGFEGLKSTVEVLAPLVGLMASGWYLLADYDLFPVRNYGQSFDYFWDSEDYTDELHNFHVFVGGFAEYHDAPLFLVPSQRPSGMSLSRVEEYLRRLSEGDRFPRAVALYLNGSVAMLLDGHHKAAACAAEGVPVPTLVIFPIKPEPALKAACEEKQRLYLHKPNHGFSVVLRNGRRELLGTAKCLETMDKRRVYPEPGDPPAWGSIPDDLRTDRFGNYPNAGLLTMGTELPPDGIRERIQREMKQPDGSHDRGLIQQLRAYAELFPHGKWLSQSEREWLKRPELDYL